jgi:hypothetical protein
MGQKRRFGRVHGMSAYPPTAAQKRTSLDVAFGPLPDSRAATKHRIILFNVTLFHSNNPGAAHLALLNEFNKSNV